jgi:hypothetical protein
VKVTERLIILSPAKWRVRREGPNEDPGYVKVLAGRACSISQGWCYVNTGENMIGRESPKYSRKKPDPKIMKL